MRSLSSLPAWLPFATYLVATVVAAITVPFRSLQQRALWGTILLAIVAGFARVIYADAAPIGYFVSGGLALCIAGWALYDRRFESARWLARASDAIVLRSPFRGRWRVAAGGPDPKRNHHQRVSDQYFAYDFLRKDGDSWQAPILAPCGGRIAHVEDRHDDALPAASRSDRKNPAGNYVSIETPRGYVILAHLKRGTIVVRNGDTVRVGQEIAQCGNSGNTTGSHLHVHAQDRALIAVDVAQGIPIAFLSGSEPSLLAYGDILRGPP
ncbi:MAG: M23 family metallopeptidase [Candidatus Eremiobacteraeota bacterium]|nr:M23 family metallopeptidase [Candidatus Eremiobacteraeota bacterium]